MSFLKCFIKEHACHHPRTVFLYTLTDVATTTGTRGTTSVGSTSHLRVPSVDHFLRGLRLIKKKKNHVGSTSHQHISPFSCRPSPNRTQLLPLHGAYIASTPPAMNDATDKLSELLSAVRGRRTLDDALGFFRREPSTKTLLSTKNASAHPSTNSFSMSRTAHEASPTPPEGSLRTWKPP